MSETEQIDSPHLDVPNRLHKYGNSAMLYNSIYELEKSRIGGMLFPQFPSLLRDCHEPHARHLQSPKGLSMLSPNLIPNERAWSDALQEKQDNEEKLGRGVDTRGMLHSACFNLILLENGANPTLFHTVSCRLSA
jgi:hypothetical protein